MKKIKNALRTLVIGTARLVGSPVRDVHTGRVLGRALLVPLGGKVHVIGLETAVIPVFVPQERLTYWKQELGFTAHPPPDFPHEPRP